MSQLTTSEGIVLKNILVTTDFSATSVSALAFVVPIAREPDHALATNLRDKVYPTISWANCPVLTVRTQI